LGTKRSVVLGFLLLWGDTVSFFYNIYGDMNIGWSHDQIP
jgi:hypothetical protein